MERSRSDALRARCIFCNIPCLHVPTWEAARAAFEGRPKWSTYLESKVIGVESLCLEGLVDYSIQAEDITIYLCSFQGTFACFFANFAVFCPS